MKNLIVILGLAITLLMNGNVFAGDIFDNIVEKCEEEWGYDYSMIEYCVKKQKNAYVKFHNKYYMVYIVPTDILAIKKIEDIPKEVHIIMGALWKWKDDKGRKDWVMTLYECNKQFEALNRMKSYSNK